MNDIYNHKIPARNPRTGIFFIKDKNKTSHILREKYACAERSCGMMFFKKKQEKEIETGELKEEVTSVTVEAEEAATEKTDAKAEETVKRKDQKKKKWQKRESPNP